MKFVACPEGAYVIHAGACEAPTGGFNASVDITRRVDAARLPVEAYRSKMLDGRRCWDRADIALGCAIVHARTILSNARHLLRC